MEGLNAGIVVRIPFAAERMAHPSVIQITLKCHAGVLASKLAVEDDALCIRHIQAGVLDCQHFWIVNTFLDNFFKVVFSVLYWRLISQ